MIAVPPAHGHALPARTLRLTVAGLGFLLLFIAVRMTILHYAGAYFENREEYRLIAAADALRYSGSLLPPAGMTPYYIPDHYSFGSLVVVYALAAVQPLIGQWTAVTFRLEMLLVTGISGLLYTLLLYRMHGSRAAAAFALLFTIMPPVWMEITTASAGLHGETQLFVALFAAGAWWTMRGPARAQSILLPLICAAGIVWLKSMLVLLPAMIFFVGRAGGRRAAIRALLITVVLAAPVLWLRLAYPGCDEPAVSMEPAGRVLQKGALFVTAVMPLVSGQLYALMLAAALLGTFWHNRRQESGRYLLGMALIPACYMLIYAVSTVEFYSGPGSRLSQDYKYLAPLLPLALFVTCSGCRRVRSVVGVALLVMMISATSELFQEYAVVHPPIPDRNAAAILYDGYDQYGENMALFWGCDRAMLLVPILPGDERGRRYLAAVGRTAAKRMYRDQWPDVVSRHYLEAFPAYAAGFAEGQGRWRRAE